MPFRTDGSFDQLSQLVALGSTVRQKHQPGAIVARRRQGETEVRRRLTQEAIGHLNEDARAIAGVRLASAGAAVQQVEEDLQPLLDDSVRLPPFDVDHEADAAGIVFVAGIVEGERAGRGGGHGLPVMTGPEAEVKYNDPIGSIRYWNG